MDISRVNQGAPTTAPVDGAKPVVETNANKVSGLSSAQAVIGESTNTNSGKEAVENAITKINEYVQNTQRSIQFEVDELTGKDIVKVLDKETDEVIRQMPLEEVMSFARNLAEQNPPDDINLFSEKV